MELVSHSLPASTQINSPEAAQPSPTLGERLIKIREEIVASGESLLTIEEIDREVAERRGGYQGANE